MERTSFPWIDNSSSHFHSSLSPKLCYVYYHLFLIFEMSSLNTPAFSYNDPSVQTSVNQQEGGRINKSFVDNKPMIQGLVRSVLKVEKNGEAHLINTGLTDIDGAKQIAQNIFSFYDKDRNGTIDPVKVPPTTSRPCRSSPTPTASSIQTTTPRRKT